MTIKKGPIWVVLAGFALSACSVAVEYDPPEIDLPDRFRTAPSEASAEAPNYREQWWSRFQDPVLDDLVQQALRDSLSLKQAQARVDEAEALAIGQGSITDINGQIIAQAGDADDTISSLSGSLALFGGTQRRAQAARSRLLAEEANRDVAQLLLLSNVTKAYIDLRFVEQQIAFLRSSLNLRQAALEDERRLFEAETATQLDVLQSEALVIETEALIPRFQADRIRQQTRIATLLGVPSSQLAGVFNRTGRQPSPRIDSRAGVPSDLVRNRASIRRAEFQYYASLADLDAAELSRYPSLSLNGVVRGTSGAGGSTTSIASAVLDIPIFRQGEIQANIDANDARVTVALAAWRDEVLTGLGEVETALSQLDASRRGIGSARRSVGLSEEAVELSGRLAAGGDITTIDRSTLLQRLTDAQQTLAENRRDFATAFVDLQIALGKTGPTPEGAETEE